MACFDRFYGTLRVVGGRPVRLSPPQARNGERIAPPPALQASIAGRDARDASKGSCTWRLGDGLEHGLEMRRHAGTVPGHTSESSLVISYGQQTRCNRY